MALDKEAYKKYTIDQYCPPMCYELAGQSFELVMDDGYDWVLNFKEKDKLEWRIIGKTEPKEEHYLCAKADETTYLLSYEISGEEPRANHTFVLDLQNRLVTRIMAKLGENPKLPYLNYPRYEFGAIREEGKELPFPRHGFTDDITGTTVQWSYGSEMTTVHVYYCSTWYRVTYPPEHGKSAKLNELLSAIPSADEPANYIKIKDNMYLLSITEQNLERLTHGRFGFRSNTMAFLQNYDRMYQIGRSFGTFTKPDGEDINTHLMFGAFGKYTTVDDCFLTDKNPYLV